MTAPKGPPSGGLFCMLSTILFPGKCATTAKQSCHPGGNVKTDRVHYGFMDSIGLWPPE